MRTRPSLLAALFLLAAALPATAQEEVLGTFGQWVAVQNGTPAERFCFMAATPDQASLVDRRDEIWFMVYNAPAWQEFGVVQVNVGYPLKPDSRVDLSIDGRDWKLFVKDGTAWAFPKDEKAILRAMRRGLKMTVEGVSARGNKTTDSYSLRGVTAAHKAIDKACKG